MKFFFALKLFQVFIFTMLTNAYCFSKDSTSLLKYHISAGTYSFLFNNDLMSSYSPRTTFIDYEVNPISYYSLGVGTKFGISDEKSIYFSCIYSNSTIGYQYSKSNLPLGKNVFNGHIKMNAILVNTLVQYKVSKTFLLNYGIGHYFNIVNKFDNDSIAREINWYNKDNKSNFKMYTISICLGTEIVIFKNLSIELNYMRGLNKFIDLYFDNDPKSKTSEKLRYVGLTINYKLK